MSETVQGALDRAQRQLGAVSESARLDAEILLAHALGQTRSWLRAWPEHELDEAAHARFEAMLARRRKGEPVSYITGRREFWSLDLAVSAATLIPRPETELLVEQALALIPPQAGWRIADLGTGSGAIALAIAAERPRCHIIATDRCAAALDTARGNAARLGISNVEFRHGDWLAALAGETVRLIVANPPYVPEADPHLAAGDVRFEPREALAAGADGLDAIRRIAREALDHLATGDILVLEHGYDQQEAVANLLMDLGYREVTCRRDLAGLPRLSYARV